MDLVFGAIIGAIAMATALMVSIPTSEDVEEIPEESEYDLSETISKIKAKRHIIEDSHV